MVATSVVPSQRANAVDSTRVEVRTNTASPGRGRIRSRWSPAIARATAGVSGRSARERVGTRSSGGCKTRQRPDSGPDDRPARPRRWSRGAATEVPSAGDGGPGMPRRSSRTAMTIVPRGCDDSLVVGGQAPIARIGANESISFFTPLPSNATVTCWSPGTSTHAITTPLPKVA